MVNHWQTNIQKVKILNDSIFRIVGIRIPIVVNLVDSGLFIQKSQICMNDVFVMKV